MMPDSPLPAALTGIRVLDLSRVLAGPWAAQSLGDLGAEVIKIEQPGKGDDTRAWGPPWLAEADGSLFSAYYLACNRNKRSVAIDIARPEGAALVRRLAMDCDVVIENFKVGGLARYGLDHAALRAAKPRLICASITGFGQDGPYATRGGYDFLVQGMGGLMSITGTPEEAPGGGPMKAGVALIDVMTVLYATIAILAALRHRDATGEGQHIDCALLDTSVAVLANQGMNWLVGGIVPRPMGNAHPNVVPYRAFAVADGHVIVAVGNDGQFRALCAMLEREDLAGDPRFAINALRVANRDALEAELQRSLALWSRDAVLAEMAARGVPGGPINRLDQVFADPQVVARAMVEHHASAGGSTVPLTRFPARLSATPARIVATPPGLGQHNAEVLTGLLDISPEEVARLVAAGVLGDGGQNGTG